MFINLLKKMNLQLSKACKIEMLKKQNNNSIFSNFISLENNDPYKVTYMYCSSLIFAKAVLSNIFYKFCTS